MENEKSRSEWDELAQEIKKTILDNRKFLDRVMDDDFEPEEEIDEVEQVYEEL